MRRQNGEHSEHWVGDKLWLQPRANQGEKTYPLVNFHIAMENHHFQWENPL